MPDWEAIAARRGIRLPRRVATLSTAGIERWLRKLGVSPRAYVAWNGAGLDGNESSARLVDFIRRNPSWSMRAWAGLVLEALDENRL
jgi:hypothetical protein